VRGLVLHVKNLYLTRGGGRVMGIKTKSLAFAMDVQAFFCRDDVASA